MARLRSRALQAGLLAVGVAVAVAAFRGYLGPSMVINLLGMSSLC